MICPNCGYESEFRVMYWCFNCKIKLLPPPPPLNRSNRSDDE